MSYFLQQAKMYVGMHIDAHGSAKFTEKKWRSEVHRGLTTQGYKDWAATRTLEAVGLTEISATLQPPIPPAPLP